MSNNNWFNPNYPPPPLPGASNNYNLQANYTNWYNGSYTASAQPQFAIPPPNFTQPPPHVYNAQYQYDYGSYYQQNYGSSSYGSSSTYSDNSLNYAEELESYRNTKAHYERAHLVNDGNKGYFERRSQRSYSRERRNKRTR